jgi:PAS domain S-box-containing protein
MNQDLKNSVDTKEPASYRYDDKLSAESTMLEELLKATEIQQLFESYYNLINIPVAIIDLNANVLLSSRWQRICTRFHRVHPDACDRCIESDTQLAMQLQEGKTYSIYTCRNGLTDCASPIIIEGKHIANVFVGQFLTQAPDKERFRRQAEKFGFDVGDYLAALKEVPIVEVEKIPIIQELLIRMTRVITNLSIDRKRAVESQVRHAIVLNTIPQSVFWKDLRGRYLGCNIPFAKVAGLDTPDDIAGKTDFDLPWPRSEAEAYRADDQAVIAGNQQRLHSIEPLQRADGSRIMIDTSKIPLVDAHNAPFGLVGIFEDITERIRAEEKSRKAAEEWRTTFDSTSDLFFLMDIDHRITKANKTVSEFLNLPMEKIIGQYCYELIHCTTAPPPECPLSRLRQSVKHEDAELYLERQNIWVQSTVDPVLGENGELLGIVHIVRDISARKKLEDQLRQAHKMEAIGTLAGGIAHDFNNILSAIIGYGELCLYEADPASPMHDNLQQVLHAGHRARDLVHQILAFSRRGETELKPVETAVILKEALKLLRSTLPTTIEISARIDSRALIMGNPTQIHQIVMNLCTNAAYAMEEKGGILTIGLTETNIDDPASSEVQLAPGPYLQFTVADSGEGIAPEHLDTIFEPYFSTKPEGEGTGLGLSVVHGIVHSCGGDIRVRSELGKGTVFDVFLPLVKRPAFEVRAEKHKLTGGTEKVLFVDDEAAIAVMVRKQLQRLGYQVDTRTDSREALALFKERPVDFDLVITDMTMPHMSGDKLAQEMLKISPHIPIILCTGFSKQISEQKARLSGIKAVATKPLVGADLAQLVRDVLDVERSA